MCHIASKSARMRLLTHEHGMGARVCVGGGVCLRALWLFSYLKEAAFRLEVHLGTAVLKRQQVHSGNVPAYSSSQNSMYQRPG